MLKEGKSIKTKFFIRIVPVVVLMILISYFLTIHISMEIINSKTENNINAYQKLEINRIKEYLDKTLVESKDLAIFVENTYEYAAIEDYENILKSIVKENKNILGIGIWFEPYVYDENKKYVGPYAMRDDENVFVTYKYSNESYDYINKSYYNLAKTINKPVFTEPFFDEVSEVYMLSFVSPFKDEKGNFLGCVSVDVELNQMQKHLKEFKSEESSLCIINEIGTYIANENITLVEEKINALNDDNKSYARAIHSILISDEGIMEYTDGIYNYRLYYTTINELNWKIIFKVSVGEITKPVKFLSLFYFTIGIVTLSVIIGSIVITVNKNIHNPINELLKEFEEVGTNEYSIDVSKDILMYEDEFCLLGKSFGDMKVKLKKHQMDLYRQMKDIEYLSYCDQLTGLRNRRYSDEMLKKLIKDKWFPISVIVADVNGLKLINDAFGHDKGDKLLNNFATVLKQTNINKNYLSKVGGDEFMIYLPHTSEQEAKQLVKKINCECKKKTINGIPLTVSLGVCTLLDEEDCCQDIIKAAEDDMYRNKMYSSMTRREKTIDLILSTLYEKDIEAKKHSKNVSKLSRTLARELELPKEVEERIRIAGRLHDIGKIGVSPMILNKDTKLNEDEYEEICKHSEVGYRILKAVGNMSDVAEIVFAHHERWDGKGYPRNLKGEKIPIESRIISIAEAYDDMITDKKYKEKMTKEEAKAELLSCGGTQFDKQLVEVFVEKVIDKFN